VICFQENCVVVGVTGLYEASSFCRNTGLVTRHMQLVGYVMMTPTWMLQLCTDFYRPEFALSQRKVNSNRTVFTES